MSNNVINPYQTFRDSTGAVRASGTVTFYENGTTTLATIYSDEALTVTQTNPYTLDAFGRIVGDVKYQGLLTIKEANSDGSDPITTDNVATIETSNLLRSDLASIADATKGLRGLVANGIPVYNTSDYATVQLAYDAIPSTGGILFFENTGTAITMTASGTALEAHWNNISSSFDTHVALEMTKSNVWFMGEPGVTLKSVTTNTASEISYIFGNSKDTPLSNIRFSGLTLDLDKTTNASAEDTRGILAVGIDNLIIDNDVIIKSSSAQGGYAVDLMNCTNVNIAAFFKNVSGGIASIFSENLNLEPTLDVFNEAIDLDKVNKSVRVCGKFYNGATSQICIDSNATIGLTVEGSIFKDSGKILNFSSKDNIAATWANHIADTSKAYRQGSNLVFAPDNVIQNCAYSKTLSTITVGDSWSDATHVNVNPVEVVRIGGNFQQCSNIRFKEVQDAIIDDLIMDDVLTTASGNVGAITLESEGDWVTYSDAQAWSDCEIQISNTIIQNCNRNGILSNYPGRVTLHNVAIDTTSTEAASTDAGVKFLNLDKRNAIVEIDGLRCANGYNGLVLNGATGSTSVVRLGKLDLTDTNSNVDFKIEGNAEENIQGEREVCYFGTIAAGTDDERALLSLKRAGRIIDVELLNMSDVTQNDTDYTAYNLRRRNSDGTTTAAITAPTSKLTGGLDIDAFAPTSMNSANIVADAESTFSAGQVLTIFKEDFGSGQATDEMKAIVHYVEF